MRTAQAHRSSACCSPWRSQRLMRTVLASFPDLCLPPAFDTPVSLLPASPTASPCRLLRAALPPCLPSCLPFAGHHPPPLSVRAGRPRAQTATWSRATCSSRILPPPSLSASRASPSLSSSRSATRCKRTPARSKQGGMREMACERWHAGSREGVQVLHCEL